MLSYEPRELFKVFFLFVCFFNFRPCHAACRASQVVLVVKNLPAKCRRGKRRGYDPWVGKIPWRTWQPTSVFLIGESHGQRKLQSIGSHRIRHN